MDLDDAVKRVKRKTGYGQLGVTNDQSTQDVLDAINDRLSQAWQRHPWSYSLTERTLTTVASTKDYTLETADGGIEVVYPQDGGKPLRRYSLAYYQEWHKGEASDSEDEGEIFGYIHIGRSSADKLKIRLVHTPVSSGTVFVVWTKNRLTEYAPADIVTNTLIQYFPKEVHRLICRGAESDIYDIQGKKELAEKREAQFLNEIDALWGQEASVKDKKLRWDLPPIYRRRQRARGGTGVA